MCGRYTLFGNWKSTLARELALEELNEFQDVIDNYNVSPLQTMPVIIDSDHTMHLSSMRWGLIPSWAKDITQFSGMINARAETIAEKPSFKQAFKKRRCIIPMNGFYEWASSAKGKKQPVYCTSSHDELMYAAGVWEHWDDQEQNISLDTYAIITVPANETMKRFHERMPAFLPKNDLQSWLFDAEIAPKLLRTLPNEESKTIFVGLDVNNARINSSALIQEVEPILNIQQILPTKPPSSTEKSIKTKENPAQDSLFS